MIGGTNDEKIEDNDPGAVYGLGRVCGRHYAHHGGDEERQHGGPIRVGVHGGLGRFFQGNPPTGFTVVHQADKNGGGFVVGKLQTASREYRVNITYVLKDGRALMQTIRIE